MEVTETTKTQDENENELVKIAQSQIDLLNSIKESTSQVVDSARDLLHRITNESLSISKGISFLDIKNEMMLSYLIELTQLISLKCSGKQLAGDSVVERLVETRTVIEKMRPIDHRLKYQIDKLVRLATAGKVNTNDPLHYRPIPENLVGDAEMEREDDNEEGTERTRPEKSQKYVPPKVATMKYDGEETTEDKKAKAFERARKRAMSSSIIDELRREFDDAPEEIEEHESYRKKKIIKEIKEQTAYEEQYFTRMNMTKKRKQRERDMMTMSSLASDLTRFENISALEGNEEDFITQKKRSKGRIKSKTKQKGKAFAKRRR